MEIIFQDFAIELPSFPNGFSGNQGTRLCICMGICIFIECQFLMIQSESGICVSVSVSISTQSWEEFARWPEASPAYAQKSGASRAYLHLQS